MFNQAVSFCVYAVLPVENEPCLLLLSVCSAWASLIKFGFNSLMFYNQEATLWRGAWWIKKGKNAPQRKWCDGCRVPTALGASPRDGTSWATLAFGRATEVLWPTCAPVWHRNTELVRVGERVPSRNGAGSEMPPGPRGWEIRGIPGSNPQGTSISSSDCFLMAPELSKGNRATGWVCISFYLSF